MYNDSEFGFDVEVDGMDVVMLRGFPGYYSDLEHKFSQV